MIVKKLGRIFQVLSAVVVTIVGTVVIDAARGSDANAQTTSFIVLDHTDVNQFESLPLSAVEAASNVESFYYHASVGSNIGWSNSSTSGLNLIQNCGAESWCVFPGSYDRTNFAEHYYDYSSPPYTEKIDTFETYLSGDNDGNGVADLLDYGYDYVGMKLCFVDHQADVNDVITRWGEIEDWVESQGKMMIWWTMPVVNHNLGWFPEWSRSNIENFNDQLRSYCATNTQGHCNILFDLADIESHDPDGNLYTENTSYGVFASLYPGYSADGGHLDDAGNAGRIRVAKAYWVLMSRLSDWDPTPVELNYFERDYSYASRKPRLRWGTASELDLVGFNVWRSTSADGGYSKLNDHLIPAQNPGSITGAEYTWEDNTRLYSNVYYYKLEAVEISQVTSTFGPVMVRIPKTGHIIPVPTAIPIPKK